MTQLVSASFNTNGIAQSSWNPASDGNSFVFAGAVYTTGIDSSNRGTASGASSPGYGLIGPASIGDFIAVARFSFQAVNDKVGFTFAYKGTNNQYRLVLTGSAVQWNKDVSNSTSIVASATVTNSIGVEYWLKMAWVKNQLFAKFWQDGQAESQWLTGLNGATDPGASFSTGQFGIILNANANSHVLTVDQLYVVDYQNIEAVALADSFQFSAQRADAPDTVALSEAYSAQGSFTAPADSVVLSDVSFVLPPLPSLGSPYGTTFGPQGNLAPVPTRAQDMVNMGIKHVRLFVNWSNIETAPGVYHFELIMDPVISIFNAAGIAVTYCLDAAPTWRTDPTKCIGKNFLIPPDAAQFLAMVAARYTLGNPANQGGLYIFGVEGANEGYSSGVDSCRFGPYAAELMRYVYPAVKAINPLLRVGPPAVTGLQLSYLLSWYSAYYSNGGGEYGDYDHGHFYTQRMPGGTAPAGIANMVAEYQTIAQIQALYGYSKKPIRFTEAGIAVPGDNGTNTYAIQRDWYINALEIGRRSGGKVEMCELFTIAGSNGFSPVSGTSPETFHELYYAHGAYAKLYPQWPGEVDVVTATRRDNLATAVRRDNSATATRRDNLATVYRRP